MSERHSHRYEWDLGCFFVLLFFFFFYRWLKVNSLLEDGSTLLMSPCDVSPADKATANGKRTSSSTPNPLRALGHHCGANSDNCWPKNKKAPRLVFQLLFFFFFLQLFFQSQKTVHCVIVKRNGSAIGAVRLLCGRPRSLPLFLFPLLSLSYT